jgi:hypothetical protein
MRTLLYRLSYTAVRSSLLRTHTLGPLRTWQGRPDSNRRGAVARGFWRPLQSPLCDSPVLLPSIVKDCMSGVLAPKWGGGFYVSRNDGLVRWQRPKTTTPAGEGGGWVPTQSSP